MERYNKLNTYLKRKFGERTLKVCVDGGFTCPNRNGAKSCDGCLFCSTLGSGEHLTQNESIENQIKKVLDYKKDRAQKFIVYFQSFSNTYAPIAVLKEKYYQAINTSDKLVGINIATRPDCINKEVVKLLHEINQILPVTVELGFQTANESIGEIINRHYTNNDLILAVNSLFDAGIETVVHIMVGLPNETDEDIANTINLINSLPISGIKIHATYVVRGAKLHKLYQNNSYVPITKDYYLDKLIFILTHIRPDIIIHRITGDPPKEIFVAPEWITHKKHILNSVDKILKEKNLYQGIFYDTKKHI